MNIFLCSEVLAFWFVDRSFESREEVEPRKKSSVPNLYIHIKEIPPNGVSAFRAKPQVMISKQTSEKQHLKPVKYTKWATRSFWSLSSSQDLESWDSYWHWCQVQHCQIWVFSIAMATTFWKNISQKSSEKSTTCHWLRLQMSITKRKLCEPDLGIGGLEGQDFCLLISGLIFWRPHPCTCSQFVLHCLFSPKILDFKLLCAFPHQPLHKQWKHEQDAGEAEAWKTPESNHSSLEQSLKNNRKRLSSWLGITLHSHIFPFHTDVLQIAAFHSPK